MWKSIVAYTQRIPVVIAFVSHKEPGFLQTRYRAAQRAANVVFVEIGIGIRKERALRIKNALFVLNLQAGQSGILIVVERRAVELVAATLGGDTNAGNARVLCTEIVGKNIEFGHCF